MPIITEQELIDAQQDAESLEQIVNGAADLNGTGIVTTRTGATVKTLSKIEQEINTTGEGWLDLAERYADEDEDVEVESGKFSSKHYAAKAASSAASLPQQNNFNATTNPTNTNDTTEGYQRGSFWVNSTLDVAFVCVKATTNAAVWDLIGLEIINTKEYGAVGDNVTNDQSAIQSALNASGSTDSPVFFNNNASAGSINYPANTYNLGGSLTYTGGTLAASITGDDVTLSGVSIVNSSGGTAIQRNTDNITDTIIVGSRITTDGYAILDNDAISDGLIVVGSVLESEQSDAFECNHPTDSGKNTLLSSSILYSGSTGTSTFSGFAYGIAQVEGHIINGVHIRNSRQEAIHIEDNQKRGVVSAVTCESAEQDGVHLLVPASGDYDPVMVTGVSMKYTGVGTHTGYRMVSDVNGAHRLGVCHASWFENFNTGVSAGERSLLDASGCVVSNSTNGVFVNKNTKISGDVLLEDCTNLVSALGGGVVDSVISRTQPTDIITVSTGSVGAVVKKWRIPISANHSATSGTEWFTVAPIATRFYGRFTVIVEGSGNRTFWVAEASWDGTTYTEQAELIQKNNGSFASPALRHNAGDLEFGFFSAGTTSNTTTIEFDGIWYQE